MKSPSRSVGSALARTSRHHRCRSHFAVMIGLLAACTGQPPAVCPDWEPAQLEVVTGNEVVSGTCFTDPEGETLTITGVSSDEEVVTVRVIGTYYQVRALSPGVATITLSAEDPAGGAASVSVPVLVPNRPPIALGDIPRARMLIGGSSRSVIAKYFGDPDGQPLTFSAASGDPDVVSAAIEDSTRLIVRGLTLGEATVTVMATDPGGLTESLELGADVLEPELVFHDHMDADAGDWSFNANTRYRFGDGFLHMGNRYPYHLGSAERTVDVAEWQYSASLGIEDGGEQYTAGLWSYAPDSSTVERLWANIGYADTFKGQAPEANWRIFYYCCYTTEPGLFGNSDAVGSIGELTELVWTSRNGVMTLAAGETTLATVDLVERTWPNVMEVARLVTYGPDGGTDGVGLFDWAELWAIPAYQ